MLARHEVFRRIEPVDLSSVSGLVGSLPFVYVNHSNGKYPCHVVVAAAFPPEFRALVDGLGLGGTVGRMLLRKLLPGQNIPPHVDDWMPKETDWRRFQVPITSHPDIKMRWPDDGVEEHLAPGWLYEVRFDRTHEVVNPTAFERIHLQIDQIDATI
jgi:hypothetical protein